MGEVLYESCNQDRLEVFTFTEEPWSHGVITYVWIRYDQAAVCRDATGGLPDLAMSAATPRGVRLGDRVSDVVQKYGPPRQTRQLADGRSLLVYGSDEKAGDQIVSHLRLSFTINGERVADISLKGDMPGAKKPF